MVDTHANAPLPARPVPPDLDRTMSVSMVDERGVVEGPQLPVPVERSELPTRVPAESHLRKRVRASEARLRAALRRLRRASRKVTPAAQLEAHPLAFVAGSIAFGFVLGVVTSRSRR